MFVTRWELLKSFVLSPFIKWNLSRHFVKLCEEYEVKAMYCLSLNEKLLLTTVALGRGIPVTWVEHQEIRAWLMKSPWRSVYLRFSRYLKIVPISSMNQKLLLELGVDDDSLVQIVHGVDIDTLLKIKRQTEKGLVVFANRFIPKKGAADFVAAIHSLANEHPLRVMLIGEGPDRDEIELLCHDHLKDVNVSLHDFLKKENWFTLLSRADVFVLPSRDCSETFSISTAEAMAAGVKVVVTKCSGIAEYLTDHRDSFLCEPSNPMDLASGIRVALHSSDQIRDAARRTATETFDSGRMLSEYDTVIFRKDA